MFINNKNEKQEKLATLLLNECYALQPPLKH